MLSKKKIAISITSVGAKICKKVFSFSFRRVSKWVKYIQVLMDINMRLLQNTPFTR